MVVDTAEKDSNTNASRDTDKDKSQRRHFRALLIGCIGVVYGDIGTSPLYAFREAGLRVAADGFDRFEIYGVISLITWALVTIVTMKYVLFLMRIDNRGEGGILSLMALAQKKLGTDTRFIFYAAVAGAALFYGDAIITPAISIMSAVEGLKLVTSSFDGLTMPLSMLILFLLFMVQKKGTAKVSAFFGPVTIVWFLAIGIAGARWVVHDPAILMALNPYYAILFLIQHGFLSLAVLGAVFLSITGAEALYADLGHFGRRPIQRAWLCFILPMLLLNYMGQGALLLHNPEALENPFFLLVPQWALLPMVILATLATIVASQAVITGAYSLTRQAIQLGFLPRMEIRHTSAEQEGQIYMPRVNSLLLYGVLLLCLIFGSSGALAAAYGIAVTGTMLIDTILVTVVIAHRKKIGYLRAIMLTALFAGIEAVFLTANMVKIFDGGYVPLALAAFVGVQMATWVAGSRYIYKRIQRRSVQLTDLIESLDRHPSVTVPGTAVFLSNNPQIAPATLMQNLRHNKVLHEKNIMLTIMTVHTPKVPDEQRLSVERLSSRFTRIIANFGYMETPDVPRALIQAARYGENIDVEKVSFFLGRKVAVADPRRGLPAWQDKIYISLSRAAVDAPDFFRIPHSQVVEMGIRVLI
ncbi:MAG TPA: potassium transporter Kup [Alphaproteobacteria bacterium]|jgi:KUP system potassium uptake protein